MGYLNQKRPAQDSLRYDYVQIPAGIRRVGDHLAKLSKKVLCSDLLF